MHTCLVRSAFFAMMLTAGAARIANAQTCIAIDEQRDMLTQDERTAARLLVGKQFEVTGRRVAERDCAETYTVSHIRLGTTITVTLSGPAGKREATALGLDDLRAVYSQMVRSLTTGQPMGVGVLDRTNVSATQDLPPRRVFSEGLWYARVGYGSLFGQSTDNGAAFGFGYRAEFDRLGLDVSFLNGQLNDSGSYYIISDGRKLMFSSAGDLAARGYKTSNTPAANIAAYESGGLVP